MTEGFAELSMYVAPPRVCEASEAWLTRIVQLLDARREPVADLEPLQVWRSPRLLLAQTCGYPLMTLLRGQVRLIGKPRYELPLSLIHISEPTRPRFGSRMPSSA